MNERMLVISGMILGAVCMGSLGSGVLAADEVKVIKHRFLAMDESRHQVIYVDENDQTRNWKIDFPERYRDYQLIGNNRLLVNTGKGYREYDMATRQVAKELSDAKFQGAESVRRLKDGGTIIGCNQKGMMFYELDAVDKVVKTAEFPKLNTLRLMRLTPRGTMVFGANTKHVIEADMKGTVLRDVTLEKAGHIYMILEKPDGHLMVGAGYGQTHDDIDKDGKVVKSFGGKPGPADMGYHFFGGFQLLKNGNIVQANWTGHGEKDSTKGVQIVEFDPAGTVVWTWHNPDIAGSIHGVIVLDELDTNVLNEDSSSLLGPATK